MRNLFFLFLGIITILSIFIKVRQNLFSKEKSFLWMCGGICLLILSIFPVIIDKLSTILGISYGPSLLFLLSNLFMLYIIFRQEQHISLINERIKELAHKYALLQVRIKKKNIENNL